MSESISYSHRLEAKTKPRAAEATPEISMYSEPMLIHACADSHSFGFLARLPAWKKPGSDEARRSPRMKAIKKEGVG